MREEGDLRYLDALRAAREVYERTVPLRDRLVHYSRVMRAKNALKERMQMFDREPGRERNSMGKWFRARRINRYPHLPFKDMEAK